MSSKKYFGYVGGAAVAAGVGAAIAVAGQGTAHADTDGAKPASSNEAKAPAAAKAPKKDTPKAGPKRAVTTPKFDAGAAVTDLKKQFAGAKPKAADAKPVVTPSTDLAEKASEAAAVLVKPHVASAATGKAAAAPVTPAWALPNDVPAPWNWSPFRYSDPIPGEMPTPVWQLEQAAVNAFSGVPILQPLVREGFESGYRLTQVIPWVNVVIPLSNVVAQFPNLSSGDAVLIKTATQSIINNLLVTTQPVSIAFYGYDAITDLLNVEYQGQQLKSWFYSTAWDVIDLFDLLHNRGQSGLPLGTNSTGPNPATEAPEENEENVALAASYAKASAAAPTTDAPGSDPFRADDPWPTDIPANVLGFEKSLVGALPPIIAPLFREGFEAVYRYSQMVPYVNAPIPLLTIVQVLAGTGGNKSAIQVAINNLLLTTPQVSLLYYGYDEIADLLNVEQQAEATKQQFYAGLWDAFDPSGVLHVVGQSGLPGDSDV